MSSHLPRAPPDVTPMKTMGTVLGIALVCLLCLVAVIYLIIGIVLMVGRQLILKRVEE